MNSQRGQAVLISLHSTLRVSSRHGRSAQASKPSTGRLCWADAGTAFGVLAQLGERLICIQEVRSSILLGSTKVRVGSSGG
jgi:hypothetical protein